MCREVWVERSFPQGRDDVVRDAGLQKGSTVSARALQSSIGAKLETLAPGCAFRLQGRLRARTVDRGLSELHTAGLAANDVRSFPSVLNRSRKMMHLTPMKRERHVAVTSNAIPARLHF